MKQVLKQFIGSLGCRVEGTRCTPQHLFYMFENGQVCTFIQVGAYDGITADPLRRYIERCGCCGVMLEPQPGPAAQLSQLYKDNSNIVVLEAAVDSECRRRTLYTIDSEDADAFPHWARGLASFAASTSCGTTIFYRASRNSYGSCASNAFPSLTS